MRRDLLLLCLPPRTLLEKWLRLHVREGAIRQDLHPAIAIGVKGLVIIICWLLGTIRRLAGHVPINNEPLSGFKNKDVIVCPKGAGPAAACIPKIDGGLIPNIHTGFTAGVFVCYGP